MLARALATICVGLALLALFAVHARRTYLHDYTGGGDSPHYLMMAKSLARDGDLRLTPQERSLEAFYEDFPLELDNRVFSAEHPYCKHPIGAPVLFALGYALGGRQGVLFEVALLATLTALFLWLYLLEVTGDGAASCAAMLAVVLAVPFLPLAANEYTEMPALFVQACGLTLLTGVRGGASDRMRLLLLGTLAGALPWIHVRYLPVALALVVAGWRRAGDAGFRGWLIAPALACVAGLYAWGWHVTGAFALTLPMTLSAGNSVAALSPAIALTKGLWGHLTDQQGGLLVYAPHLALALLGAPEVWRRWRGEALVHVGYGLPTFLLVSMYPNWSGHWGLPCRFLAVLLPGIALALVPVARRVIDRGAVGVLAVAPPLTWGMMMSGAMLRWPPLQLSLEALDVNLGAPFVYLYQQTRVPLLIALPRFIYAPHVRDYLLAIAILAVVAAGLRVARRLLDPARPPSARALAVFAGALATWWVVTGLMPVPSPLAEDERWGELNVEHLLNYPVYYQLLAERAMIRGRLDMARRCAERVLEVWPEHAPAYAQMASVLMNLRRDDATRWAERGLAVLARDEDPHLTEKLFWRGYMEMVVGRGDQARQDLTEYLRQPGPQEPIARRLLGKLDSAPGIGR